MEREYKISIIIPCFNEEGNIRILYDNIIKSINENKFYEILFIDDGSSDNTLKNIIELTKKDERVKYIPPSKNFGHQNALKAGLDNVITMDADLQHPPQLIDKMIEKWNGGYDIVYTIRDDSNNKNATRTPLKN